MPNEFEDIDEPVNESLLRGDDENSESNTVNKDNLNDLEIGETVNDKDDIKEPAKESRSSHIPRERFDEVHSKLKEERAAREDLEARLAALEKPHVPQKDKVDLKIMLKEYNTALMDQDEEKANFLSEQIEEERYKRAEEAAERKAEAKYVEREQAKERKTAEELFNSTALELIKKYPALEVGTPSTNQELIDEVVEFRDFYISKGIKPHEALIKATERVMKTVPQQEKQEKIDPRKESQAKINADTANRQPVPLGGTGNRAVDLSDKLPDKQDDYDSLPAKEREKFLK